MSLIHLRLKHLTDCTYPKTKMGIDRIEDWTEQDRKDILQAYGRTDQSIIQDIESVRKWLEQQPHLPEVPEDNLIERFLLLNKCSVEKTKQKIDWYYTMRTLVPDLYSHHPLSPEMIKLARSCAWIPCRKLTKDLHRVLVCQFMGGENKTLDVELLFCHILNYVEVRLKESYSIGDIAVFDFTTTKLSDFTKLTPMLIKKFHTIVEKAFSAPYKATHIINNSPTFDTLVTMIKSVLKEKHAKRIFVHKNYESLHEYIDKDLLPNELGGNAGSLKDVIELQLQKFNEYKDRFDKLINMKTNEALRPGKPVNDDILGFHGNFKKLSVD